MVWQYNNEYWSSNKLDCDKTLATDSIECECENENVECIHIQVEMNHKKTSKAMDMHNMHYHKSR